jgi:DNA-directed RNA polymerase specialized sigma24 family protein
VGISANEVVDGVAVRAAIARETRWLIGRAGLTCGDREDIRQDLSVAFLEAFPRFDPARSPLPAFTCLVVGRAASKLVRRRRAAKRSPPDELRGLPDNDLVVDRRTRRAGGRDEGLVDLRIDVAELVAALGPADRDLAVGLMTGTVSEYARARGVPRSTIPDRVRVLRARARKKNLDKYL